MQALVYNGPGLKNLEDHAKPVVKMPSDAIVGVTKTAICGTDLHFLEGDVATCRRGTVLGHEGVGIVDAVGPGVTTLKVGDRVLISCITACGRCECCRKGMYSHRATGGWILGDQIDGTQAEYVRIPYAHTSLYPIPAGSDEAALVMLSDILPTGFECGVLNGKVQPRVERRHRRLRSHRAGSLADGSVLCALRHHHGGPGRQPPRSRQALQRDRDRQQCRRQYCGAGDEAHRGRGVDTAIEAVGIPATFELCQDIVAAGGSIANVGVHGVEADLHLERLWSHNITLTTRLVDTVSIPILLKTVQSRRFDAKQLITHRFKLDQILQAYETFGHATDTKALKVIIEA